jgi:O-methyltransferase
VISCKTELVSLNDLFRPKLLAKHMLRRLVYRFPPVMLAPERLYLWLDTLLATRAVEGSVLEIGCYLGGTAAISKRFLDRTGGMRKYICIDTFGGFVREQWITDEKQGSPGGFSGFFSSNSPALARWVLDRHGGAEVKIIEGDILTIPAEKLPDKDLCLSR